MRLKRFGVIIGTILFLISGVAFLAECQSRIAANKIFGNMRYLTNSPYFSENASLTNGRYEWSSVSEDDVFVFYYLQYEGKYVYGDFNHDGLKDAAIIMTESNGGTAEWYTVAFLINDGKKFVHRASWLLGDRVIINSMREKNGKVFVDMFVHQGDDCMGGPTHHVKSIIEYRGDVPWMEAKRISARSIFDPIILMLKDPSSLIDLPSWEYVLRRCSASVSVTE